MNTKTDLDKLGTAQAALLAVTVGILALALSNLGAEASKSFQISIHNIGKLWIPGAEGIGPYSGKETIALIAWLASWWIFHSLLRRREWNNQWVLAIFLIGIACATTLLWPPVFSYLGHILG